MNIIVIGSGYVGLVTAACFSDIGHNVCCIDMDRKKINKLNMGEIPFSEPGLDQLVFKGVSSKNLSFTTSYKQAFSKKIDYWCLLRNVWDVFVSESKRINHIQRYFTRYFYDAILRIKLELW